MKKLLFILLFVQSLLFSASVAYSPFIKAQMAILSQMDDDNVTKEQIETLLEQQNRLYNRAVENLMVNKNSYINNVNLYESEIFSLKKIISINKRAGNHYAVIRDEVALNSYKILRSQNIFLKNILLALDNSTKQKFQEEAKSIVVQHQKEIEELYSDKYKEILNIHQDSSVLLSAQENIRNYYLLNYLDADYINYLYKFEPKMYRLNKYSKYHLISFVVYVNSFHIVQVINPILEAYNLNVMKLLSIIVLILIIYIFRKVVYPRLESSILKIGFFTEYASEISENIRNSIDILIIIININIVLYIYNDFGSTDIVVRSFNMVYGFYFTLIIFKVVNTVASIKLSKLTGMEPSTKNDLINVGIKIVNFIIVIIGLLIILYLAGVDLTAVLSGLGIGGLAVAFAAKDTISNFFGTLSILFSNVFSQGDWIVVDGTEGTVVEIGLRVTTIRTFDNALISIPNGTFANKDVKNWNKRVLGRRIKMSIGLKYDSKREDVQKAIKEIRDMLKEHDGIVNQETEYSHLYNQEKTKLVSKDDLNGVKKTLFVYLDAFADSSINILIYCFSKSVNWQDWLETKEDVMYNIMEILERNNLEFAFPSLSIYNEK